MATSRKNPARKAIPKVDRPTRGEAEQAVRTLIRWAGDDPKREGLLDTPGRVVRSYEEFYEGYTEDPSAILSRVFEEAPMDEALVAYTAGHVDGAAGVRDGSRANDPETGQDYRIGVVDGSVAAFQAELVAEVRRLLDETR